MDELFAVASRFASSRVVSVTPHGSGNVNQTYLVTTDGAPQHFILQKINTEVFKEPALIMANLRVINDHLAEAQRLPGKKSPLQLPQIIPTTAGDDFFVDRQKGFWRAISFIAETVSFERVEDTAMAKEAGAALGSFHRLITAIEPNRLADTLPGFHETPGYLTLYDQAESGWQGEAGEYVDLCRQVIAGKRAKAGRLEEAKASGQLVIRPIHGDPKISNILFEQSGQRAVAMIDLDTVRPGLIQYDIGDCLRSCCNPAGEEAADTALIRFDLPIFRAILTGYLSQAQSILHPADSLYIVPAVEVITFELGLRFFTDYLAGNRYFRTTDPTHNLNRAVVQFRLLADIETHRHEIKAMVTELTVL